MGCRRLRGGLRSGLRMGCRRLRGGLRSGLRMGCRHLQGRAWGRLRMSCSRLTRLSRRTRLRRLRGFALVRAGCSCFVLGCLVLTRAGCSCLVLGSLALSGFALSGLALGGLALGSLALSSLVLGGRGFVKVLRLLAAPPQTRVRQASPLPQLPAAPGSRTPGSPWFVLAACTCWVCSAVGGVCCPCAAVCLLRRSVGRSLHPGRRYS